MRGVSWHKPLQVSHQLHNHRNNEQTIQFKNKAFTTEKKKCNFTIVSERNVNQSTNIYNSIYFLFFCKQKAGTSRNSASSRQTSAQTSLVEYFTLLKYKSRATRKKKRRRREKSTMRWEKVGHWHDNVEDKTTRKKKSLRISSFVIKRKNYGENDSTSDFQLRERIL